MSFSLTVPRSENYQDFEDAVFTVEATPKSDARTKVGKRQNQLVEEGREALLNLAGGAEPPYSGMISGHINADLTGNVTVTLNLLV